MRAELDAVIRELPPLVRHARPPGQLPARAGPGGGRRRRRLRHGLRLPDRRCAGAGSIDPLAGPALRPHRDGPGLHRAGPGLAGDPGRARTTAGPGPPSPTRSTRARRRAPGTATRPPSSYATAVEYAAKHGRRYDSREVAAWTAYQKESCTPAYGCVTTWRQLYYDDAATLGARYDLVNRARLRGAGIWALGYDGPAPELYRALAAKFVKDTTAPAGGDHGLPCHAARHGLPRALDGRATTGAASRATTSRCRPTAEPGPPGWPGRRPRAPCTSAPTTPATRSGSAPATARATCPRGT